MVINRPLFILIKSHIFRFLVDTAGDMEVLVLKRRYWANIFDCLLVMLARLDYFWHFDELIEGGRTFITEHFWGFGSLKSSILG
jgi:hypothetical protein